MTKCEDLFMGGQKKELHFKENNWSLFKLICNEPSCHLGNAICYYTICSEAPGNTYAVKICKTPEPESISYYSLSVPMHFKHPARLKPLRLQHAYLPDTPSQGLVLLHSHSPWSRVGLCGARRLGGAGTSNYVQESMLAIGSACSTSAPGSTLTLRQSLRFTCLQPCHRPEN